MKAWRWIALTSIATGAACGVNAEPTTHADPESNVADDALKGRKCGGPDSVACPNGKFCAASTTKRCPGIDVHGTCRRIPEACTHIYLPIRRGWRSRRLRRTLRALLRRFCRPSLPRSRDLRGQPGRRMRPNEERR